MTVQSAGSQKGVSTGLSGTGPASHTNVIAVLVGCLSVGTFVLVWQFLISAGILNTALLGSPRTVASAAWKLIVDETLFKDLKISAERVLLGFALSSGVAIPLGIAIGSSKVLKAVFDPVVSIIRPLPALSWIPLSMMWLGIGEGQKYAIVFMGTFAPTLIFVIDATQRVDTILLRAARNLGANQLQVLVEVVLPGALPSILSALRVTLALAWTCIISAEMVGATNGLGFLIWNAKDWANISEVIVGMLTISASVLMLDLAYRAAEWALLPWRRNEFRM
jgi:taurine transport system permease protein